MDEHDLQEVLQERERLRKENATLAAKNGHLKKTVEKLRALLRAQGDLMSQIHKLSRRPPEAHLADEVQS